LLIPEGTIQKIREEADLVQIIGEFVKLEKKGNNFVGLCPFHPDHNPSLSVSPAKKIYTCFSCGATGNVFTFVQNYKNISFPEAVRYVGEKIGIKVDLGDYAAQTQINEKYYKILQTATSFYEFYLKNSAEGKEAREYLYKRNINDEIIKRFRIGLAPKEPDLLFRTLQKDHQPLDMIEAGVVRSGENSYYDIFRNRIMFPLEDINGRIAGFSGRIYTKSDEAKYVNSSENKVFKKGRLLYNFARNLNEIRLRDEVFVFEGFMDVIAAHRAGINHAVATMGTALTDEQIEAISRVTKNVVVCYDGDNAGIEATKRAIRLFTASGFTVRAVLLPRDLDPDDFLNRYGPERFSELLKNAKSGIEYLYEVAKRDLNPQDLSSVEAFKNEVFQSLNFFRSAVLAEKFLARLSQDLQVSVESLKEDFGRRKAEPRPETPPRKTPAARPRGVVRMETYRKTEKELLRRAYRKKEECFSIFNNPDYHYVDFKNFVFLSKISDYYLKNDKMGEDFQAGLKEDEKSLFEEVTSEDLIYKNIPMQDLFKVIKEYVLQEQLRIIKETLRNVFDVEKMAEYAKIKNETVTHKKEKRHDL